MSQLEVEKKESNSMNFLEKLITIYTDSKILVERSLDKSNDEKRHILDAYKSMLLSRNWRHTGFFDEDRGFSNINEAIEYFRSKRLNEVSIKPLNKNEVEKYSIKKINRMPQSRMFKLSGGTGLYVSLKFNFVGNPLIAEGINDSFSYNAMNLTYVQRRNSDNYHDDEKLSLGIVVLGSLDNSSSTNMILFPERFRDLEVRTNYDGL